MDAAPPATAEPERDAAAEAADAYRRKREEVSTEVRRARNWILGVGIVIFVFDMFIVWVQNAEAPAWIQYQASLLDGIILAIFVALWWFAQKRARLCCILALVLYWGLQAWLAWITHDASQMVKGPLLKIFFTIALIQGIKSAHNAEKLRADLPTVFG